MSEKSEPTTVGELKRMLSNIPDDAEIRMRLEVSPDVFVMGAIRVDEASGRDETMPERRWFCGATLLDPWTP